MFERYTEKARRVIFFARYEATQYGSKFIDTEHLLLGLLREDHGLAILFLGKSESRESIRKEIEARMTPGKPISTSVEVPLSQACHRILKHAATEADQLGDSHIGTEHLLMGIVREEGCLAAQLLKKRGLDLSQVQRWATHDRSALVNEAVRQFVARFESAWNEAEMDEFSSLFSEYAELVDVQGRVWKGRAEIEEADSAFSLTGAERTHLELDSMEARRLKAEAAVALILWKVQGSISAAPGGAIRTILLLSETDEGWAIFIAQNTRVS